MERKLERSFHKIDCLERKIHDQDKSMMAFNDRGNVSAINLAIRKDCSLLEDPRHNQSTVNVEYEKITRDHKQIKNMNDSLVVENRKLQSDLSALSEQGNLAKKFEIQSDILKM